MIARCWSARATPAHAPAYVEHLQTRYYGERNPEKQARAEARYGNRRVDRFKDRFRDAIGGRPTALIEPAADRAARDAERGKA